MAVVFGSLTQKEFSYRKVDCNKTIDYLFACSNNKLNEISIIAKENELALANLDKLTNKLQINTLFRKSSL